MFILQRISEGKESGFFEQYDGRIHTFESGGDAAKKASELNEGNKTHGIAMRYRVTRNTGDSGGDNSAAEAATHVWQSRERARLETGEYLPVPWAAESWYLESDYSRNHFPHMSTQNPGKIAFTESDEKGVADIQLRMRAGKYLQGHFADRLTPNEITYWASKVFLQTGEITLEFATTPDEIQHVYINGPNSCMSHDTGDYSTDGIHPTRVYGAGDLAVAYLKTGETEISARAICWPDKKIYTVVYGDGGEYSERFENMLDSLGYRYGQDSDFNGARILRIETESGGYVCPYFDMSDSFGYCSDSDFFIIGGGDYNAQNECGATEDDRDYCNNCNEYFNGESYHVNHTGTVCESCYSEISFFCDECEESHHVNDAIYIEGLNRDVCDYCATKFPQCDDCNERHESDDMHCAHNGETVCQSCFDSDYFQCEECGEIFGNGDSHSEESNCCDGCGDERIENNLDSGSATVYDEKQTELTL